MGMAEYIDRKALWEAFDNADADIVEEYEDGTCDWGFGRQNILEVINSVPAADVSQVRHGRWICIRKGYGEYECSVCHGVDSDCSDYYGTHVVTEQDYCPNCGSRMDGDDDE